MTTSKAIVKTSYKICVMTFLLAIFPSAYSEIIGGVEFPAGAASFADAIHYYAPGTDVGGGFNNPVAALGIPDAGQSGNTVSLGDSGYLIVQFTNNSLTASGDDSPDLYIFETGDQVELMNVAISSNAVDWIDVGDVLGQPTSIDIDAIGGVAQGVNYYYVKITDIPPDQSGFPYGEADIDAVGAISADLYCGDGVINNTEECDDGNTISGDGCSSECRIECRSPGDIDGDGDVDAGDLILLQQQLLIN